ncbi:MAG: Sec-independent protein translocase subunit TatA [Chromatiales bacterium]|nr:Sec-independent protein translocase subunit TatA [Chromatiales bacterium]
MGLGGISIWQLLIILVIVIAIFGTKRLKDIGTDLGGAVKGFRKAMNDAEQGSSDPKQLGQTDAEFSESANHKHEADRHGKA